LTGALRVGVSARLAKTALAEWSKVPLADIEEVWHGLRPPYTELFAWLSGSGPRPHVGMTATFRPLMLSHQIEDRELAAIDPKDFVAEWKWDGIRVQAVHQGGERRLFSRTGDDISGAFPDVVMGLPAGVVLDGELLVMRGNEVAPFNDLQQRLNRKSVTPAMLKSHPAHIRPTTCCCTAMRICASSPSWSDAPGSKPGTPGRGRRAPMSRPCSTSARSPSLRSYGRGRGRPESKA
jgi:DNA ligase-1